MAHKRSSQPIGSPGIISCDMNRPTSPIQPPLERSLFSHPLHRSAHWRRWLSNSPWPSQVRLHLHPEGSRVTLLHPKLPHSSGLTPKSLGPFKGSATTADVLGARGTGCKMKRSLSLAVKNFRRWGDPDSLGLRHLGHCVEFGN